MTEETFVYVARTRCCGARRGYCFDDPDAVDHVAQWVSDVIRSGRSVERWQQPRELTHDLCRCVPPPPPDRVAELEAQVAFLQSELDAAMRVFRRAQQVQP